MNYTLQTFFTIIALFSAHCKASDLHSRLKGTIDKSDHLGFLLEIQQLPDRTYHSLSRNIYFGGGEYGEVVDEEKITPLSMAIEKNNATFLSKIIKAEHKNNTLDLEKKFIVGSNYDNSSKETTPLEYAVYKGSVYALQVLLSNTVAYKTAAQKICSEFKVICQQAKEDEEIIPRICILQKMLQIFNTHALSLQEPEPFPDQLFENENKILKKLSKKSEKVGECSIL